MRRRTWIALGALALALALAYPTAKAGGAWLQGVFAVALLVALGAFAAMLPFWRRGQPLPPMPGLFERGAGTWCDVCGRHGPSPCRHQEPATAAAGRPRRTGTPRGKA